MAKVGEGDERWIVKEREDGTNCNGWHWSETNLTAWSKERLQELLVGIAAIEDASTGWCKVTELEKMVGDVTVQARKQKKFPLYELEIVLKWEGSLYDSEVRRRAAAAPTLRLARDGSRVLCRARRRRRRAARSRFPT